MREREKKEREGRRGRESEENYALPSYYTQASCVFRGRRNELGFCLRIEIRLLIGSRMKTVLPYTLCRFFENETLSSYSPVYIWLVFVSRCRYVVLRCPWTDAAQKVISPLLRKITKIKTSLSVVIKNIRVQLLVHTLFERAIQVLLRWLFFFFFFTEVVIHYVGSRIQNTIIFPELLESRVFV